MRERERERERKGERNGRYLELGEVSGRGGKWEWRLVGDRKSVV